MSREMYHKWVRLSLGLKNDPNSLSLLNCPICNHKNLDYLYVGNYKTMIGYLMIWSTYCNHGIYVSRVEIPARVKMIPFDGGDDILKSVPDFIRIEMYSDEFDDIIDDDDTDDEEDE